MVGKGKKRFIALTLLLLLIETWLMGLDVGKRGDIFGIAVVKMAWGLIIAWVVIGGFLMYRIRDRVRAYVLTRRAPWKRTFVIFATLLACLEEVVTVTMTNLAPVFGVPVGTAYITASANWLDVIFFHSVIVFIPLFIATAHLLGKYRFSPFATFVFFGIIGTFVEALYSGNLAHFIMFPQWFFVYGLMVYLPAYSIPAERGAVPPRWWHYIIAVPYVILRALPLILLIVVAIVVVLDHPNIHFPPIGG